MKRLNLFNRFKINSLLNSLKNLDLKSFLRALTIVTGMAALIWAICDVLSRTHLTSHIPNEKRMYLASTVYLIWFLKLLWQDLTKKRPTNKEEEIIFKKIAEMKKKFSAATQFLKKTTTSQSGQKIQLESLPWHLILGSNNAGKTTLLANSPVHYVLKRQFNHQDFENLDSSIHSDWWVTKDNCIIDVPENYLQTTLTQPKDADIWQAFLKQIRKIRGKQGVASIILALPLPEMMLSHDANQFNEFKNKLADRLLEFKKIFSQPVAISVVITKCDLLSGFSEFFSELDVEEVHQIWGVPLQGTNKKNTFNEELSKQFNMLIKKLNEQLLSRLHQERNPMIRPHIKDFPIQVERLKICISDVLQTLADNKVFTHPQGIYLTSAIQPKKESATIDVVNDFKTKELMLFEKPKTPSRAYFIKNFMNNQIQALEIDPSTYKKSYLPSNRAIYASFASLVVLASALFINDFRLSISHTHEVESALNKFNVSIEATRDAKIRLEKTLDLLNTLKKYSVRSSHTNALKSITTYYTSESRIKTTTLYAQGLNNLLLPEIKNYLEDYLTLPVNKNATDVYSALAAYLMLNDKDHFSANYLASVMKTISPATMTPDDINLLEDHLKLVFSQTTLSMPLNKKIISNARKYLMAMPSEKIAYIILENKTGKDKVNIIDSEETHDSPPVFTLSKNNNNIPVIYTGAMFDQIINADIKVAAQESISGNWVIGKYNGLQHTAAVATKLQNQIKTNYINDYIAIWEKALANIHFAKTKKLSTTDTIMIDLVSNSSPLLALLQTIRNNTNFTEITSKSDKLKQLSDLLDDNTQSKALLFQMFENIRALHIYVQNILASKNQNEAAFQAVAKRMKQDDPTDVMTQLRITANNCPVPMNDWLLSLADDVWRNLMALSSSYINTAWEEEVADTYRATISNHYPFLADAKDDVPLKDFTLFFGRPGVIYNFYDNYLKPFVENNKTSWQWKMKDNQSLPFSDTALRQIQLATRIHQAFFPNDDDNMFVRFTLQPYKFSHNVMRFELNMNNKLFTDSKFNFKTTHDVVWPSLATNNKRIKASLMLDNDDYYEQSFEGDWGLFKLITQSFETAVSAKIMIVSFAASEHTAMYKLILTRPINPFLSLNLAHFRLPDSLTETEGNA